MHQLVASMTGLSQNLLFLCLFITKSIISMSHCTHDYLQQITITDYKIGMENQNRIQYVLIL